MRKVSRMIRIGVLAAALAAMTLTVSACGKKKQQPEVTEVTEPTAAVEETTVEESTEAITIESEESTAETRPGSDPELTDILNDININFSEGGQAGISLRAAKRAAELMNWYVEKKPSGDVIMKTTENFYDGITDQKGFLTGLEMIYSSAKEISGKDGAALLSDAGYEGEINWTLDDVNHLFNAIFGPQLVGMFVTEEAEQVVEYGSMYLLVQGACYWVLALLFIFRSTLQGLGQSVVPTIAGVMELLMRAGAALILCEMWGFLGACWASPLAWIGSAIPLMIAYYWTRRSFRHKMVGIEG